MVKYSTVNVSEAKPLGIGKSGTVEIDGKMIKHLVSTQLYDDPTAGLRELYANAVNACKTAKEKYGANPSIEIILNPANMKLKIIEHDSMGMTMDTFKDVFCVLGRTGNFDGEKPGQFGIGMASYLSLSRTMLLETYSRETTKNNVYFLQGIDTFEDLTGTNPITLDSYGTKITLTLKLNEKLSLEDCCEIITVWSEAISKFSGIDTYLTVEANHVGIHEVRKRRIGPTTAAEILGGKPDFSIENKDYKFDLVHHGRDQTIILAGMPIRSRTLSLEIMPRGSYVLQIKNERNYKPTASREWLTTKAEKKLKNKIITDIFNEITKDKGIKASKWASMSDDFNMLKQIGTLNYQLIADKYPEAYKVLSALNIKCGIYINTTSYKESPSNCIPYNDRDIEGENRHAIINGKARCMRHDNFDLEIINKYLKNQHEGVVYVPRDENGTDSEQIEKMKAVGITELSSGEKKITDDIRLVRYVKSGGSKVERVKIADIPKDAICFDKDANIDVLTHEITTKYIMNVSYFKGEKGEGISIEDAVESCRNMKFMEGKIKGSDILDDPYKYVLLFHDNPLVDKITDKLIKKVHVQSMKVVKMTKKEALMILLSALHMNIKIPSIIRNDKYSIMKYAKAAYGINQPRDEWVGSIEQVRFILDNIPETGIKNCATAVLSYFEASFMGCDSPRDDVIKILKNIDDYEGTLDGIVAISRAISKSDLEYIYIERLNSLVHEYVKSFMMKNELEKVLYKRYFPYSKSVKTTRDRFGNLKTIKIKIPSGDCKNMTNDTLSDIKEQMGIMCKFESLDFDSDHVIFTCICKQ